MADYSQMSDRELLDNYTADSGKLEEIVSRYMKTVFAVAAKYSASADREELVSDGMQALMSAIRSYDSEKGEFAGYAYICIENRLKNTAKRVKRRKEVFLEAEPEELSEYADKNPTPEEVVIDRESRAALINNMRTSLTELEFRCMEGVMMGFSYGEIADVLKIDRKAVDNAVTRARGKLRRYFAGKP